MKKLNIKSKLQHLVLTNFAVFALVFAGVTGIVVQASSTASAATPSRATTCDPDDLSLQGGTSCADPGTTAENLTGTGGIFQTVANILLFLVGAIAVIMLIIGGLRYVTSNGDQNAVTGAKNTIMYAIIGIVVAFLAYAGVNFVTTQLAQGSGL